MKRLKQWLVCRLTKPEIGEVRYFRGAAFVCIEIQQDNWLPEYGRDELTLRYVPYFATARASHKPAPDSPAD